MPTGMYLPDGTLVVPPVDPRTWVEQAAGVQGDPLRAKHLSTDVASAVAFHRNRPLCQALRKDSAVSVTTSTWTVIGLDTDLIDTWGGHNDTGNSGRVYVPVTGGPSGNTQDWWLCIGYVPLSGTVETAVIIAGLRINGTGTIREGMTVPEDTSSHQTSVTVIDLLPVTSTAANTNYIELMAWQNTGVTQTTITSGKTANLTVRWACNGTGTAVALPEPITWDGDHRITADTTGTVSGHVNVPANREIRDAVRFLNYPPTARLTSEGSSQTIASSTTVWVSIQFPTATFDNHTGWSSGANTRYTAPAGGLYFVAGLVSVDEGASNTGFRGSRLRVNGTAVYGGTTCIPSTTSTVGTAIYASGLIRLADGDYVELQALQNQGSALTVMTGANSCSRLIVVWMSA